MRTIALMFMMFFSVMSFAKGDIAAGKNKAIVCAACHGANGISVNPLWPNLAGQHATYTLKQLQDFKAGKTRSAPTMTGMVAGLSEQDMADLAAYYASLKPAQGVANKTNLKQGEMLYRGGNFDKQIPACIACHGPNGTGNLEAGFPVLSGQHMEYTVEQLKNFKSHKRANDYNAIMQDISMHMNDDEMQAVANYIMGLH